MSDTVEFYRFMADNLDVVSKFPIITSMAAKRDKDGKLITGAQDKYGFITIKGTSKKQIELLNHAARFDSLPYLSSALSVVEKNVKSGKPFEILIESGPSANKIDQAVKEITFKAGRMTVGYNASDPFLDRFNVRKSTVTEWPVEFTITPAMVADFESAFKVHAAAGKTGNRNPEIFSLVYDGTSVTARFGEKSHVGELVIAENLPASPTFSVHFNVAQFKAMLSVLGPDGGIAQLCSGAIKIDTETQSALYMIVMYKKIVER